MKNKINTINMHHNCHKFSQLLIDNYACSTCTCVDWLKNYKCSHTIAVAYRLNLVNFNDVFMDLPIKYDNY
ncbi:hypothetical protein BpHYR1_035818 [Brachionus plicatilis]|uniref:SWIM-type domain-containing protein n=1 Tax=Brachionus plicatilis TaxID=10195 RepID=A0A3M7SF96_BRAPC|nr:hypothetical protein BpHYR1_035818 [Brachionus plicatilis]